MPLSQPLHFLIGSEEGILEGAYVYLQWDKGSRFGALYGDEDLMMTSKKTAQRPPKPNPWDAIDYDVPVPSTFLIPEHHWPAFDIDGLDHQQRVRLNRLATVFMCEMFVHFEEYI